MKQTTEQYRAKAAWKQVDSIVVNDEFLSAANGAASMIQASGMGQAVAFWLAKGKKQKQYEQLVELLAQWLCKQTGSTTADDRKKGPDLMKHITEIDSTEYRHLTTEAIAYLGWIKRFAKANKS